MSQQRFGRLGEAGLVAVRLTKVDWFDQSSLGGVQLRQTSLYSFSVDEARDGVLRSRARARVCVRVYSSVR